MELLPLIALIASVMAVLRAAWNRKKGLRLCAAGPVVVTAAAEVQLAPLATPGAWLVRATIVSVAQLTERDVRKRWRSDAMKEVRAAHRDVARAVAAHVRGRRLEFDSLAPQRIESSTRFNSASEGRVEFALAPRPGVGRERIAAYAVVLARALEAPTVFVDAEGAPGGAPMAIPATGTAPD